MSARVMTPAGRRVLWHVVTTGGWVPGVDPVRLDEQAADALVLRGYLTTDGESYTPTDLGRAYFGPRERARTRLEGALDKVDALIAETGGAS